MKRPFYTIKDMCFDTIKQHKENAKTMADLADKLMVWLVGFSIGGLSVIVSDLIKFKEMFGYDVTKLVLFLFAISIINGIVFRISFYVAIAYTNQIQFYLERAFSKEEMMATEIEDLSNEMDIKIVIRKLIEDYGQDLSFRLNEYNVANQEEKIVILDSLKNFYQQTAEWAKKDYDNAIYFAKDTMMKAYGYSKEKVDKEFDVSDTSSKWQGAIKIANATFIISCLAFIVVILILCIAY